MASKEPVRRGPNIVLLAIIGVVLLAVIAVLVSRGGGDDSTSSKSSKATSETRPVSVAGDALPPLGDPGGADPAAGMQAPVLTGETFDGSKLTIGDKGPAVIVFVTHWCPHCRREVPFLKSYLDAHGDPKGLTLYAVTTSVDPTAPNYPPSKWLKDEGWPVPTMVDDGDDGAALAFGLTAFPYFVAIGKDGTVVARTTGELEAPALESLFDAARNG